MHLRSPLTSCAYLVSTRPQAHPTRACALPTCAMPSCASPETGSGKTTLLAILAGSAEDLDKKSSLSGTVLLDGQPLRSATRRKVRRAAPGVQCALKSTLM